MSEPTPPPAPDPTPAPPAPPAAPEPSATPPATPDSTPPTPPERPDYIPEKFWRDGAVDHEAMAKSYAALETKFHTARGAMVDVPENPDGYQLKPESLPDGVVWSEDAAKRFASVFHAKGVSAEAAAEISKTFVEIEAENHRQLAEAYEAQIQEGTAALKKEWGKDYDAKLGKVKATVTQLGFDPNDTALFANPKVVSFLGKIVGMLGEDAVAAQKGAAPGNSFTNGMEEAQKIMSDTTHPEHEAYHSGDRAVIDKVRKLLNGG